MSFARAVCPPQALEAFSTGFMSKIKPQVEFNFNLQCVEFDRGGAYPRAMSEKTIGEQINDAIDRKGLTQAFIADRLQVSNNAVSKWIKTGKVSKKNIPLLCQLLELDAGIFLGSGFDDVDVTLPTIDLLPAREIAKALSISIQAIADKWGITDAKDLLDPSDAALARVEAAISNSMAFVSKSDVDHSTPAIRRTDSTSQLQDNVERPREKMWDANGKKKAAKKDGGSGGTT